ncbi:hypothetical protein AgCh_028081 [Apium graveolens]
MVPISEPVIVEAEKVSSQKDTVTGSSRPLKRLRNLNSDDKAPTVSPPLKKLKKQRAHRDIVDSDSDDVVEAAKEGVQESLISTEQIVIESLPSAQPETAQDRISTPPMSPIVDPVHTEEPGTSAKIDIHHLIVPEVLYLEAPPIQLTPPTTSILDVDQNLAAEQNLEDDVEAFIASNAAILSKDADTAGSVSSDAANEKTTGEAAANLDVDAAGPSGHAPQQIVNKADLIKKFVKEAPVPWSETPRGKEWTKEWNSQDINVKLEKNRFFKPAFDRIAYIDKTQEKQLTQIDEILKNQASQQIKLNEIQSSVELLVSLLLPADAKKGEKVIKSKYKSIQTLKGNDDGNDDHGNSYKGRESKGSKAGLKSEGVKTKSKASVVEKKFPKPKGIMIKERTNSEATKAKSQVEIDPRSKGKEKVDEPVKVYMPVMDEEITDDEEDASLTLMQKKIFQTTSDMAHVVQSQDLVNSDMTVKQATSDIAQVGLISEDKEKETSDIAHVKPSKILLPGFTKAKQTQS